MAGGVAGFTPEHEVHGSKLLRIKCIVIGVTLIVLAGVCVAVALVFAYAPNPPGLVVYPHVLVNLEEKSDSHINGYIDTMIKFVQEHSYYPGNEQNTRHCSYDERAKEGEVCHFNLEWVMKDQCSPLEKWGYKRYHDAEPCVLLAFNEPKNWIPEPYTSLSQLPKEMPKSLRKHIEDAFKHNDPAELFYLWVHCDGEFPADRYYLGATTMSPWNMAIPIYYFPITEETKPTEIPVLSLTFKDPMPAVLITVKCHYWARNLDGPLVAAQFELLV